MVKIEYAKELSEELGEMISTEFEKYANENDVSCNYNPYTFVAKDGDKVIGLITGHAFYNEVKIENFIVLEEYRDKHIGSQLIEIVEEHHCNKGYTYMDVNTHGFQAPDFYKKHGFQVDFIREDKENPKLNKYFLVKYF